MNLENFETYRLSNEVAERIWNITLKWDKFEKETIGKQLVRAVDSISANLAEGYGRYFYKENRQFCYYSRGSLIESLNWIEKAQRRKLITPDEGQMIKQELELIHLKLNAYIKSIGNSKSS